MASFWWVSQGVTSGYSADTGLEMLWASLENSTGQSVAHWDSLDQAEVDDVVLHYANGFVLATSQVAETSRPVVRPPEFELDGRTGDMGRAVLLNRFVLFDIPVALADIPIELRESERGSGAPFDYAGVPRRGYFFPVQEDVAIAVFEAAGLVESPGMISADSQVGDDRAARELFIDMTDTDGVAVVKYRREQSGLRNALFGNAATAACGICGRRYPVRYLHTAHIKPRSACSQEERKDWANVVMAACLFGCDAMFEDGMLLVDEDGKIHLQTGHQETPALSAFTKSLEGKIAPAFKPENRAYFAWRNAQRDGHQPADPPISGAEASP